MSFHSLKYLSSTTLGCRDIGIGNSEFVTKTQFLYSKINLYKILYKNRRRHVTMILHCHWQQFWSRNAGGVVIILSIISIKNEKILNSNNNISKPKFLGSSGIQSFSDWLRIYYLLNLICLNLRFQKCYTCKFSYKGIESLPKILIF